MELGEIDGHGAQALPASVAVSPSSSAASSQAAGVPQVSRLAPRAPWSRAKAAINCSVAVSNRLQMAQIECDVAHIVRHLAQPLAQCADIAHRAVGGHDDDFRLGGESEALRVRRTVLRAGFIPDP